MAKKQHVNTKRASETTGVKNKTAEKKTQQVKRTTLLLLAGCIALATYFCYLPSLKNDFTNWDDPTYVLDNKLVKKLNGDNLRKIFDPNTEVSLNYHPLTILSLAVNYHFSEKKAGPYVKTNLFFHILNTLLVFWFVYLLSRRKWEVAFLASLWFGIHPMHVESVSWISERKDVLYTFFFVAAAIAYYQYVESKKTLLFVFSFILFLLSCLSKAMAACFPAVVILIDYLTHRFDKDETGARPQLMKAALEKIPFLLLGLATAYWAHHIQGTGGAIAKFETFTFLQRIMFAAYGFTMYIGKLFVPYYLSGFYPYPNTPIPGEFYFAPVVALLVFAIPVFIAWKKGGKFLPEVIFTLLFYSATLVMVLQFISVGSAIMADRYSYVPYIALFFLIGTVLKNLIDRQPNMKLFVYGGVLVYSICFASITYSRCQVWKDTVTFWTDVITKYPHRVEVAYKNLGNYYADAAKDGRTPDYAIAYTYFIELKKMNSKDAAVYSNLGNIYGLRQQWDSSLAAYATCIELDKKNFDAYLNRGITLAMMQKPFEALKDFEKAEKIKPDHEKLFVNRAYTYFTTQQYDKSINDYSWLITHEAADANSYFYRGASYFNTQRYTEALKDYDACIRLQPTNKDAWYYAGISLDKTGNKKLAREYVLKAKTLGFAVDENYLKNL